MSIAKRAKPPIRPTRFTASAMVVSTGRRRRESLPAARKAGITHASEMKPSKAKVNCRSGLAAMRSSVRLVSESSVWNSRPIAIQVGGWGG